MASGRIPDRWLNYKAIGKRVEGTRFIAFKVPLNQYLNEQVENVYRFDGKILLGKVPSLGIIIDLTNTNRYYDPNFFQTEGVEYKKLMIPGHVTPPQRLVNIFKDYVKRFIKKNPSNDKLIGVHCTHGVNRTGFLICNYMVSEMSVKPNDAIKKFALARGHKIERHNYLDALQKLNASKGVSNTSSILRDDEISGNKEVRNPSSWGSTDNRNDVRTAPSSSTPNWRRRRSHTRSLSPPPNRRKPYHRDFNKDRPTNAGNRRYSQQCRDSKYGHPEMKFKRRSNSPNRGSTNSLDNYRSRYNSYENYRRLPTSLHRGSDQSSRRSPKYTDDRRSSLSPTRRHRSNSSSYRNRR